MQAASAGERAASKAASRPDPAAKGKVFLVEDFRSNLLGNSRTVAIYLPPGYEASGARYPVLYMQDGQNIFDPATSYIGVDWGLRETCDRLIAEGKMAPIIIVAPYNTPDRESEYTPVRDDSEGGGGRGDLYGRFLVEELKPAIDARLRTRPGPRDTAIMGSSLGGLISLHLALTRPDAFLRAGVVSPSLWWAGEEILERAKTMRPPDPRPKIWADMGTREGVHEVDRLKKLAAILEAQGWAPGVDFSGAKIYKDAEHNEAAWRDRAGDVLAFLFPPERSRPTAGF